LIKSYPWYSPYIFAANNPVRLVDIEGKGEGDPIAEHYESGNNNLMIILVDDATVKWKMAKQLKDAPGWNIVVVTSLDDATKWMAKTYGADNAKIDNLFIRTHGAAGTSICTHRSELYDGSTRADLEAKHFTTPPDIKTSHGQAVAQIKEIGEYLNKNAVVLFSACNAGMDLELSEAVANTMGPNKNLTIYMNQALTGAIQPYADGENTIRVEKPLTDPNKAYGGWTETKKIDGKYKRVDLGVKTNMKINASGGFSKILNPTKTTSGASTPKPAKPSKPSSN